MEICVEVIELRRTKCATWQPSFFGCLFLDLYHRGVLSFKAFGVLLRLFLVLHECAQHSDFVCLVFLEVKSILFSEAHL